MKYIIIQADTNDGDYIEETNEISQEQLDQLQPVFEALQKRKGELEKTKDWNKYRYNWETSECTRGKTPEELYIDTKILTEEQVELMNEFIPRGEYGIHTIESIRILEVISDNKIL